MRVITPPDNAEPPLKWRRADIAPIFNSRQAQIMKTKLAIIGLAALLAAGCSSGPVPVGKDTYMIHRGGWPAMNGFAVEADCYKAANSFCEDRGLIMVPVSTDTIDGKAFAHNASSKLVFKAIASTNASAVLATNLSVVVPAGH